MTLHSECDVIQPLFSYPIPPDADCHRYNFTVRAVNIVGMGEPATDIYVAVGASTYFFRCIIMDFIAMSRIPLMHETNCCHGRLSPCMDVII